MRKEKRGERKREGLSRVNRTDLFLCIPEVPEKEIATRRKNFVRRTSKNVHNTLRGK